MDALTIGDISLGLAFLVTLMGSIAYLKTHLKDWIALALKDQLDSIKDDVQKLNERIDEVDMQTCKNHLVGFLSGLDRGQVDEIERERFFEQYEHYLKLGGNSYIKHRVDSLKQEGKL